MKKQLLTLLLGITGGLMGAVFFHFGVKSMESSPQPQPVSQWDSPVPARFAAFTPREMEELNGDFITASSKSTYSVVYIKTKSASQRNVSWFDWFFGGGGGQTVIGSGSGVVYSAKGHIITNNHVIDRAEEIEVVLNKRPYTAKVIGTDPSSDLAVLKIEGGSFPAIKIGSSRQLSVGEWVLAVGNPFNLNSTVTAGIVSAKGRDLGIVKNQFPLESFIQTDAAINPGNSGGALVNLKGELIGINTAILSRTGSYAGYGFAVPVDIVKKIVDDLIMFGKVQKVYTGADIKDLDFETAQSLDIENLEGVVVSHVVKDGAFDAAGIRMDDVIRKMGGQEIRSEADFEEECSLRNPGEKVMLVIERDGKKLEKEVLLTNEEGSTDVLRKNTVTSEKLGADFEVISKVERDLYDIEGGVKISNVKSGLVREARLPDGFIITHVNNRPMESAEQAIETLETTRGKVVVEGVKKNGSLGYYSYYY